MSNVNCRSKEVDGKQLNVVMVKRSKLFRKCHDLKDELKLMLKALQKVKKKLLKEVNDFSILGFVIKCF